jgi:hypothetical protein
VTQSEIVKAIIDLRICVFILSVTILIVAVVAVIRLEKLQMRKPPQGGTK